MSVESCEVIGNECLPKKDNIRVRIELGKEFNNEYLTPRELDVLKYLVLGYTAKKIALTLGISVRTVETYLEVIKLKFHCKKKWEIIEKAIRLGMIDLFKI